MKRRSNQLDPRIIGGLRAVLMPNDVLTMKQASRFPLLLQGTEGYAAECLMDFQDLGTNPRDRLFRLLETNCGSPFPFRCCVGVVGNKAAIGDFSFFLPASQVAAFVGDTGAEKPKARPFTIDEFMREFTIGHIVTFRHKVKRNAEYRVIYNGYRIGSDGEFIIYLGIWNYKLQELFNQYEWLNSATAAWQPFGVEGV